MEEERKKSVWRHHRTIIGILLVAALVLAVVAVGILFSTRQASILTEEAAASVHAGNLVHNYSRLIEENGYMMSEKDGAVVLQKVKSTQKGLLTVIITIMQNQAGTDETPSIEQKQEKDKSGSTATYANKVTIEAPGMQLSISETTVDGASTETSAELLAIMKTVDK